MGRGRQKAKATKVARKLKYYSPETDYAALERELAATSARSGSSSYDDEDYSDLAAKYNDDFDDEDDSGSSPLARGKRAYVMFWVETRLAHPRSRGENGHT